MKTVTVIPIGEAASSRRDPTLEEILSDPIVLAMMQADRVDPAKLRTMLSRVANGLQTRLHLAPFGSSAPRITSFVPGLTWHEPAL